MITRRSFQVMPIGLAHALHAHRRDQRRRELLERLERCVHYRKVHASGMDVFSHDEEDQGGVLIDCIRFLLEDA